MERKLGEAEGGDSREGLEKVDRWRNEGEAVLWGRWLGDGCFANLDRRTSAAAVAVTVAEAVVATSSWSGQGVAAVVSATRMRAAPPVATVVELLP